MLQFVIPFIFLTGHRSAPVAGEELPKGLIHLQRLEKFSMDPNYFQLCQVEKSYPDRQPYSLNDPLNLAIIQLSKSCPFLNEMEIGVFVTKEQFTYTSLIFEDFFLFCVCLLIHVNFLLFLPYRSSRLKSFTFQANSSALETISSCSNLEILTLANLDVDSASFLHPVFKTLIE